MTRRRSPRPGRIPAKVRRIDWHAWRDRVDSRGSPLLTSLIADPHSWLHAVVLWVLGTVALSCGVVSVVSLGTDPPTGWELPLRLLSLALVVTALGFCVRAVRRRDPRRGIFANMLLAVAALVAAVAVAGVAEWIGT